MALGEMVALEIGKYEIELFISGDSSLQQY